MQSEMGRYINLPAWRKQLERWSLSREGQLRELSEWRVKIIFSLYLHTCLVAGFLPWELCTLFSLAAFICSHSAIKHLNMLQTWWEGALKFHLRSLPPPYDFLSDTSVSKHLISCWCAAAHVQDVADTAQPPHHLWFNAWTLPVRHKAELLAFTWGLQSFCTVQHQSKLFVT